MTVRLRDIGELEFIKKISRGDRPGLSVVKGMGDDCAVLRYTRDKYLLYTIDMIIEGVHFRKPKASPEEIGYKALAVNISDIAACGGVAKWAVVSVGLPSSINYSYAIGLYSGIKRLANRFDIDIVGGDTNISRKLVISVALIGEVKKKNLTLRSGAKDKDIICLSGSLTTRPDHLTFTPCIKKAQRLLRRLTVNSMIDISDGFLCDLDHILEASKKGALIYESLIPYRPKKAFSLKVLDTGEQFELIFTIPRSHARRLPTGFYPVGEIRADTKGIVYVDRQGKRNKIVPKGYRHF